MSMAAYIQDYLFPAAPKALEARFAQAASGQGYACSNLGEAAAAVGLKQKTGISFGRFTQQRLLQSMGMLPSSWYFNSQLGPRNATLYAAEARSLVLFWQIRSNGTVGHSGSDSGLTAFILLDLIAGRGRVCHANGDIGERPKAKAAFVEI